MKKKKRRCCMIPDNPKGISMLSFWGKNRRINGISELPSFMQQRLFDSEDIYVRKTLSSQVCLRNIINEASNRALQ